VLTEDLRGDAAVAEVATLPARRGQLRADLSLLFATLIWGTTLVVAKDVLGALPPFTFLALRFTLATATLAALFGGRVRALGWEGLRAGFVVGGLLFAGYSLQTLGLRVSEASTVGFISGLCVVLVPVIAFAWLRQRLSPGAGVGVAVAGFGLALLSLRTDLSLVPADLLSLLCSIAFAMHIVAVGRYAPKVDALALTLVQIAVVCLGSWVAALVSERPTVKLTPYLAVELVFVGVLATALVFAIQNLAQRQTPPTHAALIFTLEPVFTAVFAYLLLAERLTERASLGAALIVVGMLVAELWPARADKRADGSAGPLPGDRELA
jgi:drug/metabolite transporter (DMT)-like permease